MKLLNSIPAFLRNKYLLAFSFFVIWIFFFDHNDVLTLLEKKKELREIEKSKEFFTKEIAENKQFTVDIKTNPAAIEKFAREKYLMKRPNEDLFIIRKASGE